MSDLRTAIEKSSFRQIALQTGTNYNSLLKASKKPISGVAYDPDTVNFDAVEAIVIAKMGDTYETFDWSKCEEKVAAAASAFSEGLEIGTIFTLRDKSECTIVFLTKTHAVFTINNSTTPRSTSFGTLDHLGAKVS